MTLFKKLLLSVVVLALLAIVGLSYWARQPVFEIGAPIPFTVRPGSGLDSVVQQIADAGVPVNPELLGVLARLSGKSAKLKAGSYEIKPGTTPTRLITQLVRGEFAQESLTVIEGWTFHQMRQAIAAQTSLKHDTALLSDAELMAKITTDYALPEGLFAPDTYLFAKGSSDLQVYKQAHALLLKRLNNAWDNRDLSVPYKTPYEALIMASIVEKETGRKAERTNIAGVFVNRLRLGMLLQTDPTVIYGMGEQYEGRIRKRDLTTDTPYNTYTRSGLPPTPISLPGDESLHAAMNPAKTDALFFVAKGDGSSHFSSSLGEHNQAVNKYQR
ncbi:endolytic transglycosylase MltG [Glaciimonas sp. PAMC28666]|uniref:endolytic transglycosylase MltG n=1 Tax=Glaciimonas sp. PAMC28666 TaxID=2807626 RepID=UPI00196603CF|nr:endolytic transglycosylase MltG [Glaciimonas sp. PAMC28666]QRX82906.1 endolytic transglycosylase MltG [Glaciimonas sp. PAMC28666]